MRPIFEFHCACSCRSRMVSAAGTPCRSSGKSMAAKATGQLTGAGIRKADLGWGSLEGLCIYIYNYSNVHIPIVQLVKIHTINIHNAKYYTVCYSIRILQGCKARLIPLVGCSVTFQRAWGLNTWRNIKEQFCDKWSCASKWQLAAATQLDDIVSFQPFLTSSFPDGFAFAFPAYLRSEVCAVC